MLDRLQAMIFNKESAQMSTIYKFDVFTASLANHDIVLTVIQARE